MKMMNYSFTHNTLCLHVGCPYTPLNLYVGFSVLIYLSIISFDILHIQRANVICHTVHYQGIAQRGSHLRHIKEDCIASTVIPQSML
ncbi:hypothetical protein EMCG_03076 [[Emmonsia] crescens]|uniref:Uncharacterized protein n=1 Tax=[Emmonsia] crescens TaxID=73230 RepID=A0A0G2HXL7_9EURO|nr:hypothetical protein EMCG_03076 [Emmonsia crescens UAMH 3008]